MKNGKKLTAAVAVSAVATALVAPAAMAATTNFTDIQGNFAADAINALAAKGIIHGNPDGTFNPNGEVTREQFAIILAGALNLDTTKYTSTSFTDVDGYAAAYVEAAHAAGLIAGYDATHFGGKDVLTRQDMATIFVRALKSTANYDATGKASKLTFSDKASIASYAQDAVGAAVELGLVHGMTDGTFAPTGTATRAQVALVANTFLSVVDTLKNALTVSATLNADNTATVTGKAPNADTVQVTVDGGTATNATLNTDGTYTLTTSILSVGSHTISVVSVKGGVSSQPQTATVTVAAPGVSSVTATDLNQIKVVFNQAVDQTSAQTIGNYLLNGVALTANDTATLQADGKTVLITLDQPEAQYAVATFTAQGVYSENDLAVLPTVDSQVTFSDVTVPTVSSVDVSGNSSITINFSEPVAITPAFATNAGSNIMIDGQAATNVGFSNATVNTPTVANNYATSITLNFAVPLSAGNHTVTVPAGSGVVGTDLVDAAGFGVAQTTSNFTVTSVTTAPTITSVTGNNNGTVDLTFDRDMMSASTGNGADNPANYTINGVAATGAAFTTDYKHVELTFAPGIVVEGANVLDTNMNVEDTYGNALSTTADTRSAFNATVDTTKPAVSSVVILDSTHLRVKFNKNVDTTYATNVANYDLQDASGNDISSDIANVTELNGDASTYTVNLNAATPLTGSKYTVVISNIQDTAATPNVMDTYTATVTGTDTVPPTVLNALQVAGSTKQVVVNFSETMDASTITNRANYQYQGKDLNWYNLPASATVTAGAGNSAATITFPSNYTVDAAGTGAATSYTVEQIRVSNVKDAAGNVLADVSDVQDIADASTATGPSMNTNAVSFSKSGNNLLVTLAYGSAIASLNKTDFTVAGKTADSAYVSGNKVVLVYSTAANIATIEAAGNTASVAVSGTPTSTDATGSKIKASETQTVYNDTVAPVITTPATDIVASSAANTVAITFSEPIDTTIAGLYADDFTFTSNGQVLTVSGVNVVGNVATYTISNTTPIVSGKAVTVRANASKIDIKSDADGAGNQVKYVPTSTDISGDTVTAS